MSSLTLSNKLVTEKTSITRRNTSSVTNSEGALDIRLVSICSLLLLIGVVMVYSASIASAEKQLGAANYYLNRHLVFVCLGLVCGLITYSIPTNFWQRLRWVCLLIVFV